MPVFAANHVNVGKDRIAAKRKNPGVVRAEAATLPDAISSGSEHPLLKINGQDASKVKRSRYMADMLTSTK